MTIDARLRVANVQAASAIPMALLSAVLVAACANVSMGGSRASGVQSPVPSIAFTPAPEALPVLGPETCERGVAVGKVVGSKALRFGEAVTSDRSGLTNSEASQVAQSTARLARLALDSNVWGDEPRHPKVQRLVESLAAVEAASIGYQNGTEGAFIAATAEAFDAGQALAQACD